MIEYNNIIKIKEKTHKVIKKCSILNTVLQKDNETFEPEQK